VADVPTSQVTRLLLQWQAGDRAALNDLLPLVYGELRRIAGRQLVAERRGHTLQSTALVHEAYCRLVQQDLPEWRNRAHFYAVAAHLMRQILVDHARAQKAQKRGGDVSRLSLADADDPAEPADADIVALDDALTSLTALDPQQGRVVELRFFGGLSIEDTSEVLGISVSTVKRDWLAARAWLYRELARAAAP
jgi:RNA polymerase sigma factor (TIGR02999 family)